VTHEVYFEQLVGHVDEDLVRLWLGDGHPRARHLIQERVERFLELVADGRTVSADARRAVHAAAQIVPVAVVSGAVRVEVEAILAGAGLRDAVTAVIAFEDVERSKPYPDPYLAALSLLGLDAADAVAVEDTAVGIASAKAAGLRCVAVLGSQAASALAGADELVPRLDEALVDRLLRT
jgi:HAD superfamily hydrolase (TIGR01509 family)